MGYASKAGRARTSARNPQAHAICDRCGGRFNHVDLAFQYDWAGAAMLKKNILVCRSCMDRAQPQLRSIVLPGDPPPIMNPRPENYAKASTDFRVTSGLDTVNFKTGIPVPGGDFRITQGENNRVIQQTGAASGSLNQFPGTDPNAPGDSNPGLPYGNTSVPQTGPLDGRQFVPLTWLMAYGTWADAGFWEDDAVWVDSGPLSGWSDADYWEDSDEWVDSGTE